MIDPVKYIYVYKTNRKTNWFTVVFWQNSSVIMYIFMFSFVSDISNTKLRQGASLMILFLCFEDDLSPQRATFFPPITSDNIPHLSSSYTDVCTKICNISLSVMLLAGEAGCTLFLFFMVCFFLSFSKSDCHKQV